MKKTSTLLVFILLASCVGHAKRKIAVDSRAQYLSRLGVDSRTADASRTPLLDLTGDLVARVPGDLLRVRIVEQTTAASTGAVKAARNTSFSSGITGLPGGLSVANVNPLLSTQSARTLDGQGQSNSTSELKTDLTARVVAQLPSGALVIEANRDVLVNQERRKVTLRGVVRQSDLGPDNLVLSTQISELEIEMEGKGIVSDATKGPNRVMRLLHSLLGF